MIILSLYDETTLAVRPWAEAGFECHCLDKAHSIDAPIEKLPSGGSVHRIRLDLQQTGVMSELARVYEGRVFFLFAFPPCTDLANCGARHFEEKARWQPDFQRVAAAHAGDCGRLGEKLGCAWVVENPVGRLARLWRVPDHRFSPHEYGGYLPQNDTHPLWPGVIAPRDAYTKRTCLWSGGGFVMPPKNPVAALKPGKSDQWARLGSQIGAARIRSATPRGLARAIFIFNAPLHLK